MNKNEIGRIQNSLLGWYSQHGRDLPWRRDYNPYHVWVSEIMLQQTQMERGVEYFLKWINRFPDVDAVAEADETEILKYWEGLGYYARARNLHKTARVLVDRYSGQLPEEYDQLLKLHGIGPYTAAAVSSIAFNKDHPVLDANVERVYARLFDVDTPLKEKVTTATLQGIAEQLLPVGRARDFNQALMDFGASICKPKIPECDRCMFQEICKSHLANVEAERPVVIRKSQQVIIQMVSGILVYKGKAYIQQRLANDVWGGLWEFPGGEINPGESACDALVREFAEETEYAIRPCHELMEVVHYYTKYKVFLKCYSCEFSNETNQCIEPQLHAAQQYKWADAGELNEFAFSAGHRKIIDALQESLTEITKQPCW